MNKEILGPCPTEQCIVCFFFPNFFFFIKMKFLFIQHWVFVLICRVDINMLNQIYLVMLMTVKPLKKQTFSYNNVNLFFFFQISRAKDGYDPERPALTPNTIALTPHAGSSGPYLNNGQQQPRRRAFRDQQPPYRANNADFRSNGGTFRSNEARRGRGGARGSQRRDTFRGPPAADDHGELARSLRVAKIPYELNDVVKLSGHFSEFGEVEAGNVLKNETNI